MVQYDFDCPIYQAEDEVGEDCELPEELARLLRQEEKAIQPHQEDVEVINLGTEEDKREVKVGASLQDTVKTRLIELLHDVAPQIFTSLLYIHFHFRSGDSTVQGNKCIF